MHDANIMNMTHSRTSQIWLSLSNQNYNGSPASSLFDTYDKGQLPAPTDSLTYNSGDKYMKYHDLRPPHQVNTAIQIPSMAVSIFKKKTHTL